MLHYTTPVFFRHAGALSLHSVERREKHGKEKKKREEKAEERERICEKDSSEQS